MSTNFTKNISVKKFSVKKYCAKSRNKRCVKKFSAKILVLKIISRTFPVARAARNMRINVAELEHDLDIVLLDTHFGS